MPLPSAPPAPPGPPTLVGGVTAEPPAAETPAAETVAAIEPGVALPHPLGLIANQVRRAFVPGQPVHLSGTAPADCDPVLYVDEERVGPVDTDRIGEFDVDVDTSELGPGQHLAEVVCSDGAILQTGFWVAATQTSSNTLSVALVALLVLSALGWVSVRGLISSTRSHP